MDRSYKVYIILSIIFLVFIAGGIVYFYNKSKSTNRVIPITDSSDNKGEIKILTPKKGDVLFEGKSFGIKWQFNERDYPYIAITLQHNDGMCGWLMRDNGRSCIGSIVAPNTGNYSFEIPYDLVSGDYRFYLEACLDKDSCPPFYKQVVPRTITDTFKIEPQLWKSTTTITKENWGVSFSITPEWQMISNINDSVDLISKIKTSRTVNLFYYPSPQVDIPYGPTYYWNVSCGGWCASATKRSPDFHLTDKTPVFIDTTKGERRYIVSLEHELFLIVYTNDSDNDGLVRNLVESIKLLE